MTLDPGKHRVERIFDLLAKTYPSPTTELHYETPFQLLIAVVMSAQSTDKGVNKVTEKLFQYVKQPEDMEKLSLKEVEDFIKTLGLFKAKARYLKELSVQLRERFNGRIPAKLEELIELSGVGRKTANVVLNTLYGISVIAVDTHVFRVSKRLNLSAAKTPLGVEQDLMNLIPKKYLKDAHHSLILHGRKICQARKPLCHECGLKSLCTFDYPVRG
jgi:endonuclease-3